MIPSDSEFIYSFQETFLNVDVEYYSGRTLSKQERTVKLDTQTAATK